MAKVAIDHYTVEGEPGTWSRHDGIDEAIQRAKALGVPLVKSVAYDRDTGGVDVRVAWASVDCPLCLLPDAWQRRVRAAKQSGAEAV